MLLPLDVNNELLQLSDLRIEYLLEELWGEFLGDEWLSVQIPFSLIGVWLLVVCLHGGKSVRKQSVSHYDKQRHKREKKSKSAYEAKIY